MKSESKKSGKKKKVASPLGGLENCGREEEGSGRGLKTKGSRACFLPVAKAGREGRVRRPRYPKSKEKSGAARRVS
jgi:hypothetical protein